LHHRLIHKIRSRTSCLCSKIWRQQANQREIDMCSTKKILKSTGTLTLDTGILQTYIGANGAEVRGRLLTISPRNHGGNVRRRRWIYGGDEQRAAAEMGKRESRQREEEDDALQRLF
jgi:hypothetical protein